MKDNDFSDIEWRIDDAPVDYAAALAEMEARAAAVRDDGARELVWLLTHPPLYTAGTSAKPEDLLTPDRFPVFDTGRGGQYTYHGPGQRIAYAVLDLKKRGGDVRAYVHALEDWIIETLNTFGIRGERREGRVGIWVARGGGREDKIAAIGVRVRRWVTFHGIAVNVDPELEHFSGIIPCGIDPMRYGVTSIWNLGHTASMEEVDSALIAAFGETVGGLGRA